MAHARRKFFDLHATNKSQVAEKTLHYIAALYEVEREVRELEPGDRQRIRREKASPIIDVLHAWIIAQSPVVRLSDILPTPAVNISSPTPLGRPDSVA